MTLANLEQWWAWIWTMEFRAVLSGIRPEALRALRAVAAERLSGGDPELPIRFRMDAYLTIARSP
jgi:hypothetical protein